MWRAGCFLLFAALGAGCGTRVPAPTLAPDTRRLYEQRLEEARAAQLADPGDPDAFLWVGRRTAYLGDYHGAIRIFSAGIARFPRDARFFRHRGHRYLTLRRLDRAAADLEHAAALVSGLPDVVEPDGIPNARNTPTSTLQSNIWYHLGLARYVAGDYARALVAYQACLGVSRNPDMRVATTHWLWMTLRRLGRDDEARAVLAPIRADLDVFENRSYLRLLLLYKGELSPDSLGADPAEGYGVGNWHLVNGRRDEAVAAWRRVVAGGQWASFGYIAAERELRRMAVDVSTR